MKTVRNFNRSFRKWFTAGLSMKACMLTFVLSFISVITFAQVTGQSDQIETNKGIVASIAPYDADVREAILQASLHPAILTELQKSQKETVAEFQRIIGNFSQKKQGYFYTLTRYPDLIHTLATLPSRQSKDHVNQLLPNQDEDLQQAAWKLYKGEKDDLVKVDNTKIAAEQNFNTRIQSLDPAAKTAFQKLATMPDVLTLMTNNVDLTTRLGEEYKNDPSKLNNHLSALHDSLSVQNQYEVAAFRKKMAEDPQAMKEYSDAAQAYAKQNGYNLPNQQNYNNNPNYYGSPSAFGNPYSYWYGYPYWYSSPMWYPGSLGFNSGFYMGMGGFGFYGFPSYGFSNWFYNGGYYRRYPHLYTQFGNYYRGNIGEHRVIGSVNHGFMGVAHGHYNPNGATQLNHMLSPSGYSRPSGIQYQNRGGNITHPNANSYHTQSWGGYGGRGNVAGGFHGGGGFSGGGRGRH